MFSLKTIAVVILSIYAIQRLWKNYQSKNRVKKFTKYLESNNEFAIEFANELDILVMKEKIDNLTVIRRKLPFTLPKEIEKFKLNFSKEIQQNCYLFTTLAKYSEIEGKKEVTNYMDLNFKLVIDENESSIEVYSDLYTELIDKNLRNDFARNLISELKSV